MMFLRRAVLLLTGGSKGLLVLGAADVGAIRSAELS